MRFVVVSGNPGDGFLLTGPFDDRDEAQVWAEAVVRDCDWWVMEVHKPDWAHPQL